MTTWLFNTKLGRTVLLAVVISVCWAGFRWYYIAEGKRLCQSAQASAVAKSNVAVIDEQNARDSTSSTVAAESAAKSAAADKAIGDKAAGRQETIKTEYAKPVAKPVESTGCIGLAPVPDAVQSDFDAAVKEINDAR